MRVLITDPLSDRGIEILRQQEDISVDVKTDLTNEELLNCIGDYDALIVRSGTQVTAEVIEAAEELKAIGRAGVGIDNVDLDAATRSGVQSRTVGRTGGGRLVPRQQKSISPTIRPTNCRTHHPLRVIRRSGVGPSTSPIRPLPPM